MIKDSEIYRLILRLVRFPDSRVYVHFVAAELYDLLEKGGCNPPPDLARHLVRAEDDLSEAILQNLIGST